MANRAPTPKPGGPYRGRVGDRIRLDGSQSSDPDGVIRRWRWQVFAVGSTLPLIDLADRDGPIASIELEQPGTFQLKLIVTDNNNTGRSASTTLVVEEAQTPEPIPEPPDPTPTPQDCVMSEWQMAESWPLGACQADGQQPWRERWTRTIITPASHGGQPCGVLDEARDVMRACTYVPPEPPPVPVPIPDPTGNHYFESLVASAAHYKSNSLRSQALINGVSRSGSPNLWVTYDPSMDAAKTVIPAFQDVGYRVATMGPDRITLEKPLTAAEQQRFITLRGILVDDEVMTVNLPGVWGTQFPDTSTVLVHRAQFGTVAAQHAAGAKVELSANSLLNMLQVPILTEDGHRYVITWDARYTDSYVGTDNSSLGVGHKEFRFNGPNASTAWFQIDLRNDGTDGISNAGSNRATDVGVVSALAINQQKTPTNITTFQPLKPQANRFVVKPKRWIRHWLFVDQLTGHSRDEITLYVADAVQGVVKVFDRITLDVPVNASGVPILNTWWLEQNSSYDRYRGARRDLESHVRNWVALKNPDLESILIPPTE